uniref:phosphoribosylamine--glycine ligase n=1 Tax=Xiphophorus couchianus TaxID=32473 RepID=A0A3B5MUM2_9TELE
VFSSKSFAKAFMERHGVPTARYGSFSDPQDACSFIRGADFPALVVKASGLAAGKGVIVAGDRDEACRAVMEIDGAFGSAGTTVVIEELLEGQEVSVSSFDFVYLIAFTKKRGAPHGRDGKLICPSQVSEELLQQIRESILQKTVDGMRQEGTPYMGVLYAGLMLTNRGPKVLEFNSRFGDPECQVLLPLLQRPTTSHSQLWLTGGSLLPAQTGSLN